MAKYRYSRQSSNSASALDSDTKRMYFIILACAAFVVIALVLCLSLQEGKTAMPDDIPVVEQGDGLDAVISDSVVSDSVQQVSTSDGIAVIDEQAGKTDEFTVTVTGADGEYKMTSIKKADAATLTISAQNETSFSFKLAGPKGTISGSAYFTGSNKAFYEGAAGGLGFTFASGGIDVYQDGAIEELGGAKPDGRYIKGEPTYIDEQVEQNNFDIDLRNSQPVKKALIEIMSKDDYNRMEYLFGLYEDGNGVVYSTGSPTYDKNGNKINVDGEIGAIKYYAFEQGTGQELVLICTNDAKVYIGISDGAEYRYYTNDPAYKNKAPASISGQANTKNMTLVFA